MTDGYLNVADLKNVARVRFSGIKPNAPFYIKYPESGAFFSNKNFPIDPPVFDLTTAESEDIGNYVTVAKVGANYQYNYLKEYNRKIYYISLPEDLLKQLPRLSNGNHFFELTPDRKMVPISIEEAVFHKKNYIRLTAEMGKIILIVKKPLQSTTVTNIEYWSNNEPNFKKRSSYNENGQLLFVFNTGYDENGHIIYMIDKYEDEKTIYQFTNVESGDNDEKYYDLDGRLVNHIITSDNNGSVNQYYNKEGKVYKTTDNIGTDETRVPQMPDTVLEEEQYASLPIDEEMTKKYNSY